MKYLVLSLVVQSLVSLNAIAAEQCQPYELSSDIDANSGIELVYDISFPLGCDANPVIHQSIYQYEDEALAKVIPVARGSRCAGGKKWHHGACCHVLPNGLYKCPPKKCEPWMGPGCRRTLDDSVGFELFHEGFEAGFKDHNRWNS